MWEPWSLTTRVWLPMGKRDFTLLHNVYTCYRTQDVSTRSGREADHQPPSSSRLRKSRPHHCPNHIYSPAEHRALLRTLGSYAALVGVHAPEHGGQSQLPSVRRGHTLLARICYCLESTWWCPKRPTGHNASCGWRYTAAYVTVRSLPLISTGTLHIPATAGSSQEDGKTEQAKGAVPLVLCVWTCHNGVKLQEGHKGRSLLIFIMHVTDTLVLLTWQHVNKHVTRCIMGNTVPHTDRCYRLGRNRYAYTSQNFLSAISVLGVTKQTSPFLEMLFIY
jgi:hypothetical protein